MDWIQQPERRHSRGPYSGKERREPQPYADEMPKDPTPGDPGPDTRGQSSVVEKSREVERERSQNPTKPGEFSNT